MGYAVLKGSAVYVYFHDSKAGKNRPLPRKETKHLDGASSAQVDAWIQNFESTQGYQSKNTEQVIGDRWHKLIKKFIASPEISSKNWKTISWYEKYLVEHVLVYFVNFHGLNDPYQWIYKSAGMLAHLQEKKVSPHIIIRCNVAVRAFWSFLIDEGEMHQSVSIRLKNPKIESTDTPLSVVLTPKDIIKKAKSIEDLHLRLALLCSYFLSLRPQEIFALFRTSFFTGSKAADKEASKVMKNAKMFWGLVVDITAQRTQDGTFEDPKSNSFGFVACFNKEAAELIVETVNAIEGPLFPRGNDFYFKKWKLLALGFTIKDGRRMSLYWLAHNTKLTRTAIKNHARQKKSDTTDKYFRRPKEVEDTNNLKLVLDIPKKKGKKKDAN